MTRELPLIGVLNFPLASLNTYKFLLDTQAGLTNLTNGVGQLNGTGLAPLEGLVNQIQPVLESLEDTIDQFGADFSVQQAANQASECVSCYLLSDPEDNTNVSCRP